MKQKKQTKKKRGRPKAKDPVKSRTVSLKESEAEALIERHNSLTEAIKKML